MKTCIQKYMKGLRGCQAKFISSSYANYNSFHGKPQPKYILRRIMVQHFQMHEATDSHRAAVRAVAKAKSGLPSIECESAVGGGDKDDETDLHVALPFKCANCDKCLKSLNALHMHRSRAHNIRKSTWYHSDKHVLQCPPDHQTTTARSYRAQQ